jgi:hypothetical protein
MNSTSISDAASTRYKAAYSTLGVVRGFGTFFKFLGFLAIGVAVLFAFAGTATMGPWGIVIGAAVCLFALLPLILGILIEAVAEQAVASLDIAVHSSPFMTDEQKADAMRLSSNLQQP